MTKIIIASLVAATALTSFSAQAEGRWPNWYVGLHGSMAFVGDVDVENNPGGVSSFSQDQGIGYGASLGYRPATNNPIFNKFRLEAEWHKQGADVNKVDVGASSFKSDGETVVQAAMANVYYDFVMADANGQSLAWAPYIGAGLGMAQAKIDGTAAFLGNVNDTDDVLAWQFMAGLSYAPTSLPSTEWTLGYRYFDTANPEYSYLGVSKFSTDISSHNLEAGVHFLF
jgi:opacity protein-like surface antigen